MLLNIYAKQAKMVEARVERIELYIRVRLEL